MLKIEYIITKKITEACNKLNIKPIVIKFNCDGRIGFAFNLNNMHNYITIELYTLLNDTKINNNVYCFKKFRLNSVSKRIKFIIYHEVGHYLQFIKYRKWFRNRDIIDDNAYEYCANSEAYRNIKQEKIADKIALYLLNKEVRKYDK